MQSILSSERRPPVMNGVLSFLLVDDNPDDRALVIRELSREFPESQFTPVVDFLQLTTALNRASWSLVVTDYQLRWSDGLTVLMAVKSRWPDCPVIMFTGSGNEEVAVQAMRAGLDDYVLKHPRHYSRLAAAAHLAVERANQRRRAREATLRYETLFNRVPVGLFCLAPDGRLLDANPAMVEMLGYPDQPALLQVDAGTLVEDPDQRRQWLAGMTGSGGVQHLELQLRRLDGKLIWAEINTRTVADAQGRTQFIEGSAEDITARKKAEVKLRVLGEQWHALAAHLQSVRDQERNYLAREVRAQLEEALASLRGRLVEVGQELSRTGAAAAQSQAAGLESLKSLPMAVDVVLGAAQKIGADLRPAALDERGLGAAIQDQIQEFGRRTGIQCELDNQAATVVLDPERATAVFRILQDALTAVVCLGQATRATVRLRAEENQLVLEVQDNGRGLSGRDTARAKSLDLLGMRERATRLDGRIEVISRQGKGTFVGLRVPLSRGPLRPKGPARN